MAEQLSFTPLNSLASFSVSGNGVLAYLTGSGGFGGTELLWFDRSGKRLGSAAPPGTYYGVDLSPDGRRAAVGRLDPQARNTDIWTFEFARGVSTRFTFDPAAEYQAVWSPDGNRLAFASTRNANGVYQKVASGEGNEELVFTTKVPTHVNAWSPDGRFLLYAAAGKAATELWILPLTGDRKPAPYLESQFNKPTRSSRRTGREWLTRRWSPAGRRFSCSLSRPPPRGAGGRSRRQGALLHRFAAAADVRRGAIRARFRGSYPQDICFQRGWQQRQRASTPTPSPPTASGSWSTPKAAGRSPPRRSPWC